MKKRVPKKNKLARAKQARANHSLQSDKISLHAHLHELKRRLLIIVLSIGIGSAIAYAFEHQLIDILLKPSHGQEFVYTSPMGGVNFLFSVCLFMGIAISLPVIVYQLLQFLFPLMQRTTKRFVYVASGVSGLLALGGILFGYFIGLPAALQFLLRQQFHSGQVEALITIQAYFSFVTAYMVAAALMFQLPLILVIINRIKPLKPSQMFKAERAVIAFAFIAAFIMNPTPNLIDQLLVVLPILVMYQLGIGLVWLINRNNKTEIFDELRKQDAERQAERASRNLEPLTLPSDLYTPALSPITEADIPETLSTTPSPTSRPQQYVTVPGRRTYVPARGLVQ